MGNAQLRVVEDQMNTEDRKKALDAALGQIERSYGKGSVMRLGDDNAVEIEAISTGSLGLDIALGIGGLPRGVCEIYGPESLGQDDAGTACVAEARRRRHLRLCRCRTCARPDLCPQAGRRIWMIC